MIAKTIAIYFISQEKKMKKLFLLSILFFILVSCTDQPYGHYGAAITVEVNDSYSAVMKNVGNRELENVSLTGEIIQTCAKKGCWLKMKVPEGDTLMVRFRDYGFFVPRQGVEGKKAIVKGSAFMDTVAVEMLRHYAEDAGESEKDILKITEPDYVLGFIADGVLIEK